jgi:hypothetical protein
MKIIYSILFIIISYTAQAQNQSLQIAYFKHLVFRETPYAATKGRIPISEERSKNENHYKLSYNTSNQLVLIEYKFGGVLVNRRRAGNMDGFRNIATKTKIQYLGDNEIRTFYDVNNIQCSNPMNVYKEVYNYNKKGEKIGAKFYDKNDKLTNNSWNIAEYLWSSTTDNGIVEKRKNTDSVFVTMRPYYKFMTTLYKYTNDGILISMNHIDDDHNLIDDESGVAIDKAEYDTNLNLIGFKFYNTKNEPVIGSFLKSAGGKIEYDEHGNCVKYATINLDDKLMISRKKAYDVYQFDTAGNVVEISSYDTSDEVVKLRNVLKRKFIYNSKKPFKHLKTEYYHNE